jgi:hypothetical protein
MSVLRVGAVGQIEWLGTYLDVSGDGAIHNVFLPGVFLPGSFKQ